MADEIKVSTILSAEKGSVNTLRSLTVEVDWATARRTGNTQAISHTAHVLIVVGSGIGTPGFAFFRNASDVNFVQLGLDVGGTFHAFAKLKPGEAWLGRLATGSVYAKADTASVDVDYEILAD